jgi:serine protease Do
MRTLPKIVARTKVGKSVIVKVWRNQKLISKKVILGRLESSGEFKAKIKPENEKKETSTIDSLKITVRILTDQDVAARKLPEGTKGLVITKIELTSPLNYLQVNDIIVEVQKKKITSIKMLNDIVNDVLQSDESNLLIVVYNNQNQRRYLGVKIK